MNSAIFRESPLIFLNVFPAAFLFIERIGLFVVPVFVAFGAVTQESLLDYLVVIPDEVAFEITSVPLVDIVFEDSQRSQ
jgi:hypothetical protein